MVGLGEGTWDFTEHLGVNDVEGMFVVGKVEGDVAALVAAVVVF